MKNKFKYGVVGIVFVVLVIIIVAFFNKNCMAHYYLERMTGHEYPNISNYHKTTVDEMNDITDQGKEQKLKKVMAENKINGVVLFGNLSSKPNVVENSSNGDAENKIGPNVLYPIASLQKLYTGIAVQKLIDDHKISLATTINKFYPNIAYGNKITIGDLLSHLSGIEDGKQQASVILKNENDALSFIEKNLNSTGKIGKWNYSDSDYALLAGIVSKVSGMSYQGYINKNIIIPYKLKNTKFYNQVNNTDVISGNVQSIGNGLCFENLKKKMSVALGAGGMLSSATDYWNFINYLISNKIIPLNDIISNSNHYYDGVYLGQGTFHADGSINGCQSCFITNYNSDQAFIFFSNNISFKQMLKIRGKLAKICFE